MSEPDPDKLFNHSDLLFTSEMGKHLRPDLSQWSPVAMVGDKVMPPMTLTVQCKASKS